MVTRALPSVINCPILVRVLLWFQFQFLLKTKVFFSETSENGLMPPSDEQFPTQCCVCAHLSGLRDTAFQRVKNRKKKDTSVTFTDFETKPKKAMQIIENISVVLHSCLLLSIVPIINPSNVMVIMFEKLTILIKQ